MLKISIMIQNLIRNRRNVDEVSLLFDIRWSPPPPDSAEEASKWWNKTVPVAHERSPPMAGKATLLFIHVPKSKLNVDDTVMM